MIKTMNCNSHDAQLQFNLYKMSNSSEVKGNYTINTPIDDTMDVSIESKLPVNLCIELFSYFLLLIPSILK